jgi:hypothetical protein
MRDEFGGVLVPQSKDEFGGVLVGSTPPPKPQTKPEDVGILSGTGAAFKRGFESYGDIGSGYGIAGLKIAGRDEELAKRMAEIKAEQEKQVEKPALSFADLERIYKEKGLVSALSNVPKYVAESFAESAPQMAAPLAAGAAASPFLTPIGGALVGVGTYGLQQFGNLMQRQAQERQQPEDISVGKAATAAAIQAPIGYVVDRFTLGMGGLGQKGVAEVGKELAKRKAAGEIGAFGVASGVAKEAGKGASKGFIAEAPTEVLEQSLERWQAGLPLANEDAYKEYKEAFFGAGAVGVVGGAGSRGLTAYKGYKAPEEVVQQEQTQEPLKTEQGQLLLPRPDEILVDSKKYDPVMNPMGNFADDDLKDILTPQQIAYIKQDRIDAGKPKIDTYSIEDVYDALKNSVDTEGNPLSDEAQKGFINQLLTVKAGYTPNAPASIDSVMAMAESKNIETGTQGFKDFLTRVTGTDRLNEMEGPQLYAAFKSLSELPASEQPQILPQGTNAIRFSEKQYDNSLKGLEVSFGELGDAPLSPTSVKQEIKDFSGLERDADVDALYRAMVERGDLEVSYPPVKTTEGIKNPAVVNLAGKVEALPSGLDIRNQAFKQGEEPEAYEVRNGKYVRISSHKTKEEAQKEVENQEKTTAPLVKTSEKAISNLEKFIEKNDAELARDRALGYFDTDAYKNKAALFARKNKAAKTAIKHHENTILNLKNPYTITPSEKKKPIVKKKQVLYKDNKPVAAFEDKSLAEEFGIRNLDDKTLEQIIASAPNTKGTLPKRYAAMAEKELARRRGEAPKGIEVKRSFFNDEVKDKADELEKTLRPALKRFGLENVALRIVDSIRNGTADGEWSSQVIKIALDAKKPMGTLRHESIHALKELGAFTDAEWKVLENKAKGEWVQRFIKDVGLYDKYKEEYKKTHPNLEGFDAYINEEAIAEAFKYFENFQPPAGMIGNIFYRISQLMQAIRNAFNGAGFNTAEKIFTGIDQGAFKQAETAAAGAAKFQINPNEPRKIGDRIVGAPPNAPTEADRKKLITKMVKLLEHPYAMYDRSKDWYERSGETIREIARDDPVLMEQIVRLTALYSQANSLGGNITAVIKSVAQIANGNQKILAGRFPETTANVIPAILSAKTMDTSLKGVDDKLMNFYRNLHDATFETDTFQDSSTIDRWMMRLFGYPHTDDQDVGGANSVSTTQYKYAKDLVERITKAQGKKTGEELKPRQIQAVLWTFIKNDSEYKKAVETARAKAIEEKKPFNEKAVDFEPDTLDFSDYVKRATAHITWETRPSESIPMIQGIHKAPREQQDAFNRAVQAIFTDANGEDKIFKLLNNEQLYSSQLSIGAYDNKIAPNIITKVVLQKDEKGHVVDVAREYAAIVAFVTKQDAVPWYRPDPTASGKLASKGFKVSLDVPVTQELEENLFKHLNEVIPGVGFTKVDDTFDFINYRGEDGKPYMMSDKKYIEALENALETFSSDVQFNIDEFRAQSEYFSNDWKEQTNGEGHLSRISPERLTNIQPTLDNWRKQYESIAQRFGEEYGWNEEQKFSFRSFKPIEPTFRPSEGGGRGITLGNKQEGSITVEGIHYGKAKADELDASKYGTGLRGAESRRLEDAFDERIKNRVYFYIPKPSGEMPSRESGVGSYVYTQTFDNILGQGKEMSRLYSEAMGDPNNFESAIIDAGYDGYAIPEMGMMVVLNHNVPVNYEGTVGELSETGRLKEGKVLPSVENKNAKFSLALGSVAPSTFLVSDKNPNNTGDLAYIPANSRVMQRPIRLAVGTHSGLNDKGFGANHIIDRVRKDPTRKPPALTKDLLEDIILNVENVGKTFTRIYKEENPIYGGVTYILYEPKTRESLIVRPRAEYYEVITAYKQDVGNKYGNPIWSGVNVQPEQTKAFLEKQQGISVKAGERGVETEAVATVVKKRRVLSPEALQQMADDMAGTQKFSLRAPDTVPFKRWFGSSKIVNPDGTPKVMYHGTARDITVFKPKQAGAIFVTDMPRFAEDYTSSGENFMRKELWNESDHAKHIEWIKKATNKALKDGDITPKEASTIISGWERTDATYGFIPSEIETQVIEVLSDALPSYGNIMPVYVKAENPFDYDNPKHIAKILETESGKDLYEEEVPYIKVGAWDVIERAHVQRAIKEAGFDSFYVKENSVKNLGVYSPTQIKSAIGNTGEYNPENPDIRYSISGEPLPSEVEETGRKDNLTFLLQDKQIDLKRIIENIKKHGKELADKWNAYLQEELYYGRSAARVKYFIDRELNPILKKMSNANISLEQMDDYLHARHAKEANAYLRTINKDPNANSGMSDQEADAYMASITDAQRKRVLEGIAKEVDAITKQTRQMMVDYGIESQKTIDQMEKTYKHYVPLFREETEGGSISTGRGFNIRGSTTRQRTGSSKKVVDVFANIALQRERTIARGEKNRVGNSLLGLILQNPDKNFWTAIRPDEMSKDGLESMLLSMGLNPDVARNLSDKPKERILNTNTGEYEFKTNPLWLQQPNIFITRVNGEDRIMAFNQNNERSARMAVVFNNLDSNQKAQAISMMGTAGEYIDKTMKGVGTATRYFAAINTQYNPAFSIFNFLRDVGGATLNLQSTALKGKEREVIGNSLTALREIYKDLRLARDGKQTTSKWGKIFEDFEMEGGKTGFRDIFNTSEDRANALAGELKAFTQGGARTKAKVVFDWLSDFNEAVENSIRVSAYKSAIDMGMSKQQAASLAKNLTVNFNRTGAASKNFTMLYAFFNASVQGTARIAETLMKDGKLTPAGKKIVYGGISVGVFQAVILAMSGFEEDEPPEFVKDKNFIIPYGDKKYIAIPLPLGFNMFPAFGRRITEFAMSDDKNVGKSVFDMGSMIIDSFNPLGSATFAQTLAPTLIDPVIALAENKDFSGKPISRDDLNSLNPTPGYTRAKENASAVSTGLAYAINFLSGGTDFKKGAISPTPDQIDYLIGQVTGGVGREALKVEKAVTSVASGEELATFNVPVLGRMIGDVKQKTVETSRFYENVKTLNEHQHEIEGRLKAGEDINEYLADHPEALMYKYADQVYNKVNDMKRIRRTMKEQGMSSDDLKIYDENILMMMTVLNEAIRDMKATR